MNGQAFNFSVVDFGVTRAENMWRALFPLSCARVRSLAHAKMISWEAILLNSSK